MHDRRPGFDRPAYVWFGCIRTLEENRAVPPFTDTGSDFRTAPRQPAQSQIRWRRGAALPGPTGGGWQPPFAARRPAPARAGHIEVRASHATNAPSIRRRLGLADRRVAPEIIRTEWRSTR